MSDETKPYLVEFRTQRHATQYRTVVNAIDTKSAVALAAKQLCFICNLDAWEFYIPAAQTMDNKNAYLDLECVSRIGR